MNWEGIGFTFGHDYMLGKCVYCGQYKMEIQQGQLYCSWVVRDYKKQEAKKRDARRQD